MPIDYKEVSEALKKIEEKVAFYTINSEELKKSEHIDTPALDIIRVKSLGLANERQIYYSRDEISKIIEHCNEVNNANKGSMVGYIFNDLAQSYAGLLNLIN